jgi:tetratricopeptide (TPR) repeat protein
VIYYGSTSTTNDIVVIVLAGISALIVLGQWLLPLSSDQHETTFFPQAHELVRSSFKLGDEAAANYPYITKPIEVEYNAAFQALLNTSIRNSTKRGVIIFGESNAGKTRLALEILIQTLPKWFVLRWRPDSTINSDFTKEIANCKQLAVFIDDLQDYASIEMPNAGPVITLRTLFETLYQFKHQVVFIVTCRSEDENSVRASLDWLIIQLKAIIIPTFSVNTKDSQVVKTISEFQNRGNIHIEDWDGTLGSLVLGLSTKKAEYLKLSKHYPLSKVILQAMKLLKEALVTEFTEQLIRITSTDALGAEELQKDSTWREAVDYLALLQFIIIEDHSKQRVIGIRQDTYFDKVITDYLQTDQPSQVKRDLRLLKEVFIKLRNSDLLVGIGIRLMTLNEPEEALNICEQVITLNPQKSNGYSIKSLILVTQDKNREALDTIEQALSLNPKDANLLLSKGNLLLILNQDEEALANLDLASSLRPNDAFLLYNIGTLLLSFEKSKEALAYFDRVLSLDSKNIDVWINKSQALLNLKQNKEALDALEHASSLNPNSAEIWAKKCCVLDALERYEENSVIIEHALALNSKNAHTWMHKGRSLTYNNRDKEALDAFDEALSLNPKEIRAWEEKGTTLLKLKRYKEALDAIEHALSLNPKNVRIWYKKANALENLERNKEALDAFDKVLSNDPKDANIWIEKGKLEEKIGRYKKAREAFDRALSIDPKTLTLLHKERTLGQQYRSIKNRREALNAFDRIIATDPKSDLAWLNKGCFLERFEQHKEALETLDHALKLNPKNAHTWHDKGRALSNLSRYEEALDAFNYTIALGTFDIESAWMNKVGVLLNINRSREALKVVKQALSLYPEHAALWVTKGRVLMQRNRYKRALKAFNESLFFDRKNVEAIIEKNWVLINFAQDQEALKNIDFALSFEHKNSILWLQKSCLLERAGEHKKALDALKNARDPKLKLYFRFVILYKLQAHLGLKQHKEALDTLHNIKSLDTIPSNKMVNNIIKLISHKMSDEDILSYLEHFFTFKSTNLGRKIMRIIVYKRVLTFDSNLLASLQALMMSSTR